MILSPLRAKKEFTPVFEKLFEMGVYGMNHDRLVSSVVSGEQRVLVDLFSDISSSKTFVAMDIGAHKGEYTRILKDVIPHENFKIFCIEPSKECYSILVEEFKNIKNISIHNVAIGKSKSPIYLVNPGYSTAYLSTQKPELKKFELINQTTFEEFCVQNKIANVDLLKIDAEGSEFDILSTSWDYISTQLKPRYIQFEFGENNALIEQGVHFADFYSMLTGSHYTIFKVAKNGLASLPKKVKMREIYYGANYMAILQN